MVQPDCEIRLHTLNGSHNAFVSEVSQLRLSGIEILYSITRVDDPAQSIATVRAPDPTIHKSLTKRLFHLALKALAKLRFVGPYLGLPESFMSGTTKILSQGRASQAPAGCLWQPAHE